MRISVVALAVAALWVGAPAEAQQGQPSPAADAQAPGLPVSLDRIRQALARSPAERLKGLDEQPTFRVEITEKQKFQDLLSTLDFRSGPVPPGGLYAYEMQQVMTPRIYQPYALFTDKELLVLVLEKYLGKYLFGPLTDSTAEADRARDRQEAREEVDRALAKYLAAGSNPAGTGAR